MRDYRNRPDNAPLYEVFKVSSIPNSAKKSVYFAYGMFLSRDFHGRRKFDL